MFGVFTRIPAFMIEACMGCGEGFAAFAALVTGEGGEGGISDGMGEAVVVLQCL